VDLLDPEAWVGVWGIDRRFEFETPGAPARFLGQATVRRVAPKRYLYEEEGFVEGSGTLIHATQRYWLRPGEGSLEVSFAGEGELPFTSLRPAENGGLVGTHVCGPDRYTGSYRTAGPDAFEVEWRVEGPRKRGAIRSTLTRATDEMGYA